MALLLDIGDLTEERCNHALEIFCKANSEPPEDDDGIFSPHENAFIRRLVEVFTNRGLTRLAGLAKELMMWLKREKAATAEAVIAAPDEARMLARWTPDQVGYVRTYLEHLPPEQFTLSDWRLVVEYLVQRYLPADVLQSEAEWLAVRSTLMGRVQANLKKITAGQADKVLAALPSTVAEAQAVFALSPMQRAVMEFGAERCAAYVTAISDSVRLKMRDLVMRHQEALFLGDRAETAHDLQTKLLDSFGTMNRDWRRIALTEAGENSNQGMVSSQKIGSKLKRIEQYRGACPFCRKIDGKVVTVVEPGKANKDADEEVWTGKTNIGRSASPRKRVGNKLIAREPDEMWVIPAGTVHPHCRGRWIAVAEPQPGHDPAFAKWLDDLLRKK